MSVELTVSLPRFEGPLDLLLSLVRKNQVSITEIPIAEITRQYLDYLHQAEQLNIDLGGDFAYTAATVILIKTRSLLPQDGALEPGEPDPRAELVRDLLDYEQVKRAADFLERQLLKVGSTWSSPPAEELEENGTMASGRGLPDSLNLLEVLCLAKKALEVAQARRIFDVERKTVTVAEMLQWLEPWLRRVKGGRNLLAEELFRQQKTLDRKIALFLAMLEMSRSGRVRIDQELPFAAILLHPMSEMVRHDNAQLG